jgi:hypothetical protein
VKKVAFLFLNGLHQLYHTAMTAMHLGQIYTGADVVCLSCNREHTEVLEEIRSFYPETSARIVSLKQPFRYKYLNYKKKSYPFVNTMIRKAGSILRGADAVVTTSHGTAAILNKYGIDKPRVIYQYHGCGDRKYGFDPAFSKIDLMLLPGTYHRQRLVSAGIVKKNQTSVVGWPKFDYRGKKPVKLFDNENPTVLYCPHWEPSLTSYNRFSKELLDFFRRSKEYNLVFAPHVLVKHWHVHYGYDVSYEEYRSENIVVDYGSSMSTNGTYLRLSDIYIGDVSSMVYEFIAMKPRPCIFLNAHNIRWENNQDYRFWEYGPVLEELTKLLPTLKNTETYSGYISLQKSRIPEYFDMDGKPGSVKAAEAILNYCENNCTNKTVSKRKQK